MERVRTALNQLQQQSGFVVVFSHGFFIKAMLWQILANPTVIDAVAMNRLLGFSLLISSTECVNFADGI